MVLSIHELKLAAKMNTTLKKLKQHYLLLFGSIIIFFITVVGCLGPLFIGSEGIGPNLENHLVHPSFQNLFGYGVNGISVLSWLIYGIRTSLIVAVITTTLSITIGVLLGLVAGYFSSTFDAIFMRTTDIILAFPGFLLALYLAAVMPPSIFSLIFALSAMGWVSYARLTRAQVYSIKNIDFVTAAKAMGASPIRIIFLHILPNIAGPILIQASYGLSVIILSEASLTFLGLGLPIGTPSLGALLDQGVANLFRARYLAIFPGICIALCVLGFNFLGDGLRDILDPKSTSI